MTLWIVLVVMGVANAGEGWEPVLNDDAYRFCNEAGAQADSARDWCDLLSKDDLDRCPGLRATCDGAAPTHDVSDL